MNHIVYNTITDKAENPRYISPRPRASPSTAPRLHITRTHTSRQYISAPHANDAPSSVIHPSATRGMRQRRMKISGLREHGFAGIHATTWPGSPHSLAHPRKITLTFFTCGCAHSHTCAVSLPRRVKGAGC